VPVAIGRSQFEPSSSRETEVSDPFRDRILALAGVFQGARLTQQLAREGQADKAAFFASVNSILMLDATSTAEVYGGVGGVRLGLTLLRDKLTGNTEPNDVEMARYVISLIQLEAVLGRRPEMLETIRTGIAATEKQMQFFAKENEDEDVVHPTLVEKLAELYSQTLSTLNPRIMVNGEHGHLANPLIAAKVRAALFAGIRSAVLWRQKGGNRWQLLFSRKKTALEAGRWLDEIKPA
jgi:high frequency lysogenization protein